MRHTGKGRESLLTPGQIPFRWLPEEVVNHVHNIAGARIDKQDIVIIAHPAATKGCWWQAIVPRITQPVPAAEIERVEIDPDTEPLIAMTIAIGVVIAWGMIPAAILVAIVLPVIAAIVAPTMIPVAAVIAVVGVAIIAIVASATFPAAIFAAVPPSITIFSVTLIPIPAFTPVPIPPPTVITVVTITATLPTPVSRWGRHWWVGGHDIASAATPPAVAGPSA